MKGTIKVLNASGHTTVEYDTDKGIVDEAEAILREADLKRSALFDGTTREPIERTRQRRLRRESTVSDDRILSEHEEIVVVPPMAGGR